MGANPRLITADDLLRMPRGERRYELVRGVLVSKALSENLEGTTIARVSAAICKYADDYDYGCPRSLAGNPDSPQAVVFLTSIINVTVGS